MIPLIDLYLMCIKGHLDCRTVKKCPIRYRTAVLPTAVKHGRIDAVRFLLDFGADVYALDLHGNSAVSNAKKMKRGFVKSQMCSMIGNELLNRSRFDLDNAKLLFGFV